jgi:hypothetical protein
LVDEVQDNDVDKEDNSIPSSSNGNTSLRSFWDGGLLANTPLRQTINAYRDFWYDVKKLKENIPRLRYGIINLHPAKEDYLPSDYDGIVSRMNDVIFHDRTRFDENIAILMSDFIGLVKSLMNLAKENGASEESLQKIFREETKSVLLATGKHWKFEDLLTVSVDVDYVVRLERKNDTHTISNKTFDFSKSTIQQLIQDGYQETKEQMIEIVARLREMNK